jgi:hypothetical protein
MLLPSIKGLIGKITLQFKSRFVHGGMASFCPGESPSREFLPFALQKGTYEIYVFQISIRPVPVAKPVHFYLGFRVSVFDP